MTRGEIRGQMRFPLAAPMVGVGLPVEPLIRWWDHRTPAHCETECGCVVGAPCRARKSLAHHCGWTEWSLMRRALRGWISAGEADSVACRLGVHPAAIWPAWFDVHLELC